MKKFKILQIPGSLPVWEARIETMKLIKKSDNLEQQLTITINALIGLSILLIAQGYKEKASEAKGASNIAKEWLDSYKTEKIDRGFLPSHYEY